MTPYETFLQSKSRVFEGTGIEVDPSDLHPSLFPFQRDLTRWALRKGRAAILADTGLGKTRMQLEWARHIPGDVLILAPLAVAQQTVAEAAALGMEAHYRRSPGGQGITVTNYEMAGHFDAAAFTGVVLDESSILKSYEGATTRALIEAFAATPYRLCCTATPAPNDHQEFANHAEFLGIMSRQEMLATFFVHDDAGWRLKGHARQPFYRWLASWGMSVGRPSDLGYDDAGYNLPPLAIRLATVATDYVPDGQLFATTLHGVSDRAQVRKGTLAARVERAVSLITAEPEQQWIAWCGLNQESQAIARALPDAIEITGSMSPEEKAERIQAFVRGEYRVAVSKPRIMAFGLNLQNAARQVFVGISDSYEQYYQAIRRSWRFGQQQPVTVHIVLSDLESPIYNNVLRKEREALTAQRELIANAVQYERAEIASAREQDEYTTDDAVGTGWRLLLGDSTERLAEIPAESVDLSVYSPPFASLYTYSNSDRDLGNSADRAEFFRHYRYVIEQVLRVTKPGRNTAVHVQQIASTLNHDGVIGLTDFRGDVIRAYVDAGWIYHGEVCIDKDPQAQAIRTHSKSLLFVQLRRDAAWMRPALADYILVFRKPGENAVPVVPDVSNNEWIEFARPIWYGIRESDTLNVAVARERDDERHVCPLQLGTIERCIRLWSNRGELVLSPFAGIGSEGVVALRQGRRFLGCELKRSYWSTAVRNLQAEQAKGADLFAAAGIEVPA